jgi:predicted 3-demethylubiquinone-9 3-methyltransferase (glyoxalase superfamily)
MASKPQACGWLIDRFGLRWQIVSAILDEMMRDKDRARLLHGPFVALFLLGFALGRLGIARAVRRVDTF